MKKYIIKVKSKELYLHQHIGNGKLGEDEFDLSSIMPGGALIIQFNNPSSKYKYKLNTEQFVRDCHDQYLKDKKE